MTSAEITGRTLHLVDLDNLIGVPALHSPALVLGRYLDRAGWCPADIVLLAGAGHVMAEVMFDVRWMACRPLVGHGRDGADRRLLDQADPEWVSTRFKRLVIGSGDHAFGSLAHRTRREGLTVEVIARVGSVSGQLAGCVDRVIAFSDSWLTPCLTKAA